MNQELIQQLQTHFRDRGKVFRYRPVRENGQDTEQTLGVRITNAENLFNDAYSIQIFDRSTVALSLGGFDNDSHVKFDREDGAEFVRWMLEQKHIPQDLFDALPQAPAPDALPGPINDAKVELIRYLAEKRPAQFGPFGTATHSADFYSQVLAMLKEQEQEEETDRIARDFIVMLEAEAHQCYSHANKSLKLASFTDDAELKLGYLFDAHSFAAAAVEYIAEAQRRRSLLGSVNAAGIMPPPPEFPEAISVLEVQTEIRTKLSVNVEAKDTAAKLLFGESQDCKKCGWNNHGLRQGCYNCGEPLKPATPAAPPEPVKPSGPRLAGTPITGPGQVQPGAMVVVCDPESARFKQMGFVAQPNGAAVALKETHLPVSFDQSGNVEVLKFDQLNQITE